MIRVLSDLGLLLKGGRVPRSTLTGSRHWVLVNSSMANGIPRERVGLHASKWLSASERAPQSNPERCRKLGICTKKSSVGYAFDSTATDEGDSQSTKNTARMCNAPFRRQQISRHSRLIVLRQVSKTAHEYARYCFERSIRSGDRNHFFQ
jgi:hypothetical protein